MALDSLVSDLSLDVIKLWFPLVEGEGNLSMFVVEEPSLDDGGSVGVDSGDRRRLDRRLRRRRGLGQRLAACAKAEEVHACL